MKNIHSFIFFALIKLQTGAQAAEPERIPMKLDSFQIFNLGPGCRFKAKIPHLSKVSARYDHNEPFGSGGVGIENLPLPQDYWGIDFHCSKSSEDFVVSGWAVLRGHKWKLNDNATNRLLVELKALRFYELAQASHDGWAVTYDDTFGEEKFRRRTLSYCLVRLEKAICGESNVGFLESIAKKTPEDLSPYVLRLLRNIEFLEDVVPLSSNGLESVPR